MAIKFAPKDPVKDAAAAAVATKVAAARSAERERADKLAGEAGETGVDPETGSDLFGSKSAAKRKKK